MSFGNLYTREGVSLLNTQMTMYAWLSIEKVFEKHLFYCLVNAMVVSHADPPVFIKMKSCNGHVVFIRAYTGPDIAEKSSCTFNCFLKQESRVIEPKESFMANRHFWCRGSLIFFLVLDYIAKSSQSESIVWRCLSNDKRVGFSELQNQVMMIRMYRMALQTVIFTGFSYMEPSQKYHNVIIFYGVFASTRE
ncbi:hypothetical protein BDC45DRAFT_539295 [Circinella umbellata]|nr:hypothetical protein BDC45DRAFT_539295 [Circinella umbellata]